MSALSPTHTHLFVFFLLSVVSFIATLFLKGDIKIPGVEYASPITGCVDPANCCESDWCQGNSFVFRTSFGLLIFYAVHIVFLAIPRCGFFNDYCMCAKFIVLIGIITALFWAPNTTMHGYGDFARFASCFYLLLQCMIIVDWGYNTNECLYKLGTKNDDDEEERRIDEQPKRCGNPALLCTIVTMILLIIGEFVVLGFCFKWFATNQFIGQTTAFPVNCDRNNFFIYLALILTFIAVFMSTPIFSSSASLVVGALICFYTTYLTVVGLVSDPKTNGCNSFAQSSDAGFMIVGAIISAIALVYGANYAAKTELTYEQREIIAEKKEEEAQDKHNDEMDGKKTTEELQTDAIKDNNIEGKVDDESQRKNALRFHFVMFFASAYMAMLFTNWGDVDNDASSLAQNEAAVWVNIVSSWGVFIIYAFAVCARVMSPDRFSDGDGVVDEEEDV